MEDTNYDESYSDSDSEFVTEIENLPILNFDIDTYQDKKISSEFDKEIEEILLDQSITNNKYTPCVIVDNDNNERRIQQCNRIDEGGSNQPLAQLKGTWEVDPIKTLKLGLPKDLIYSPFDNQVLPTLLITQIAFKLAKIDLSDKAKVAFLKEKDCAHFGNLLGESFNQIYAAFQNPNPNSHLLFEYTTQNTSKGYPNIETCYQHVCNLLVQEVYLTKKKIQKEEQ
ncbi:34079_t:CDS:2, partial [Gigaspora margarita]